MADSKLPKHLTGLDLGEHANSIARARQQMDLANQQIAHSSLAATQHIANVRARAVEREEGILEAAQLTLRSVEAMRNVVAAGITAAEARENAAAGREARMIELTHTLVRATWVIAVVALVTLIVAILH